MGSNSKSNGSGGGGCVGGVQIPAPVKKVVQNLKEIVNNSCTDSEIYAVLRDCNMDPSDAVQRLLSQDTFHEVKSRRERRKEMKEIQELKTRANNGASNLGISDGGEHSFGQSGSIQISSNELGKAAHKKENGSVASIPYSASSTLRATGQTWNEQPSHQSNSFNADYRRQSIGTGDMIDSSMQPSCGSQSTWKGISLEHVAMADIVRMGRPKSKGSQMPYETSYTPQDAVPPNSTIYQMKPSLATSHSKLGTDPALHSSVLNMTTESGKKSNQHDFDNEWPVNEPITASSNIGATMYSNQSYLHINGAILSINCWSDNILAIESNVARTNLSPDHVSSAQASNKKIFMIDSEGTCEHDDELHKDTSLPDSYGQISEPQEGKFSGRGANLSAPNPTATLSDDAIKAASSAAVNLQQLSLGKEERAVTPTEDNHGVVLPNYLQNFSADCSHLSFGTYKCGKSTALSQPQTSGSLTNDLEETLKTSNGHPSSVHLNSGNLVCPDEKQLEFGFDTDTATADSRNYNSPKFSETELRKLGISDGAHGNDYVSPSSMRGSSFKNIQKSSSALSFVIDPNARNLPPLASEVSYTSSIPSDLLAATIQSIKARASAAFLSSQSISSRYISSASTIKNPTASMSEVLNSGAFSVSHPSSPALHGANLATGPVLKDHLYAHSYPQTGYPATPHGHMYTPSALQLSFPDGNVFHESHTGMNCNLPSYRSASTSSSLPWLSSYTLGYQSLGNSTDITGSFLHNLSAGPAGGKVGCDDFLRSQYSDGVANFNLLRQSDGSATWDYGHGSRTISSVLDGASYSLRGQNHHLAGYQQGQRQSQLHGALGYAGIYDSQTGMTVEQQQRKQNLGDMILEGYQGSSSKQLPQIGQRNY